jgi:ribulose-phosphate 3-epimerase
MQKVKIVPAILNADMGTVNDFLKEVQPHVDLLQIDVMDNVFVPNKTEGPEMLAKIKTGIPLDFHFMVQNPSDEYLQSWIDASSHMKIHNMTVHLEACPDLDRTIGFVKSKGIIPGIALNPATPLSRLQPYLDKVNFVLMMTVVPGFSGQGFMEEVMPKISELRKLKPAIDIEVDGGITDKTAAIARKAGANIFVANSYILKAENKRGAISKLKEAVQ